MRKIVLLLIIMCFGFKIPAYCFDFNIKRSANSEIRSVVNEHNKAMAEHDIEKVKTFYDKDYKSSDGFDLDDLISMLEKTHETYKNIKYKTKINNITAYNNWALVQMSDKTSAKIYPVKDKDIKKEKMGKLEGRSVYIVYLKKENDNWKIVADDILMEETSLKYGVANDINMDLITPVSVQNGKEYDLSLKVDKPEDMVALASISREEIAYPPVDYQEKFRKVPETGGLVRLVKANNKNLDEYAVASIGFSKISLNEEMNKARIEVLGLAYIMKRINVEKNPLNSSKLVESN